MKDLEDLEDLRENFHMRSGIGIRNTERERRWMEYER